MQLERKIKEDCVKFTLRFNDSERRILENLRFSRYPVYRRSDFKVWCVEDFFIAGVIEIKPYEEDTLRIVYDRVHKTFRYMQDILFAVEQNRPILHYGTRTASISKSQRAKLCKNRANKRLILEFDQKRPFLGKKNPYPESPTK